MFSIIISRPVTGHHTSATSGGFGIFDLDHHRAFAKSNGLFDEFFLARAMRFMTDFAASAIGWFDNMRVVEIGIAISELGLFLSGTLVGHHRFVVAAETELIKIFLVSTGEFVREFLG